MSDYPKYLKLRDTGFHDDQGGSGQRIFTTAGQGYKTVQYVRANEIERLREIEKAASDLRGYARRIDGDAHTITLTIIADDWEAFKKSLDHLDTQESSE